jgi:uncharacterized membrane protein
MFMLTRCRTSSRQAATVFVIFLIAQVLDGLLTFQGIRMFGIGIEANRLIAAAIQAFGPHWALFAAKLLACLCGYILYRTASHEPLAITTGLYLGVAIVPWILLTGGVFSGF